MAIHWKGRGPGHIGRMSTASSASAGLSLDFTGASLPAGVTYTGNGGLGTRVNASGVIEQSVNNTARFDYSTTSVGTLLGILAEPARTNIWLQSSAIYTTPWAAYAISNLGADNATSPDGTTNADTVRFTSNSGLAYQNVTNTNGLSYTQSQYHKRAVASDQLWRLNVRLAGVDTFTADLTATSAWQRAERTYTASTVSLLASAGASGATANQDVQLFGAQCELVPAGERAGASTYIPTTTASVTRTADAIAFTIPAGITSLRYTFDDLSTQDVAVSSGAYVVPTNLNRAIIRTIVGS